MTIGKLAKAAGVKVDTINYYEQRALMSPTSRGKNGYRVYNDGSLGRVRFIKKAQWLGFSLDEIKRFIEFDGTEKTKDRVLYTTMKKIEECELKLKELLVIKTEINDLVDSCKSMKTPHECPFIGFLSLYEPK